MPSHLVGYEELTATFTRIAGGGLLTHAYCFEGDRAIGKATFARSLATYLEQGDFEGSAAPLVDCTAIEPGESNTIGIEAVRELRRFLWQTPFRSSRRIAIIDGAGALTPEAQGALLKIVEEPPVHALLLLVSDQVDLLLPPLRSRLFVVYVPRLPAARVKQFLLERRGMSATQASHIADRSFGSIGRALAIADGTTLPTKTPRTAGASVEAGDEIERMLIEAHAHGFRGYQPGALAWLTARLELVCQYHVNQPLQRRAVDERLRQK